MSLRKQLNGAYEMIDCVGATGVKYCPDNTVGQQPMLDFFDNKLSLDTPIINDVSDGLGDEYDNDLRIVGDVNEKIGMSIITEIKNLFIRYGRS